MKTDQVLDRVRLENDNSKLEVHAGELGTEHDLVVYVTAPTLARLDVDGPSAVRVQGLDETSFTIDADGWANVYAAGRSDHIRVTADAWSDVNLQGLSAQVLDLDDGGFADITRPALP